MKSSSRLGWPWWGQLQVHAAGLKCKDTKLTKTTHFYSQLPTPKIPTKKYEEGAKAIPTTWQSQQNNVEGKADKTVFVWWLWLSFESFGISGAQSIHPCLWCTASKTQNRKPPTSSRNTLKGHSTTSKQITESSNAEGRREDLPSLSAMSVTRLCLTWSQHTCHHPMCTLCWVLSKGIIHCYSRTATLDQEICMALAKELHSDFEDNSPFGC